MNLNGDPDLILVSVFFKGHWRFTHCCPQCNHGRESRYQQGGGSKKEGKTSASEKINSPKGVVEINVKDWMTKMEGLFIAIAQLDPSIKLEHEASPAIANKQKL